MKRKVRMSIISIIACLKLLSIIISLRHIRVIKMTQSDIWNYQDKACVQHKLRNIIIHCTLNLTVRKVIKWLNYS